MQKPWMNDTCRLVLHGLFSLLSYSTNSLLTLFIVTDILLHKLSIQKVAAFSELRFPLLKWLCGVDVKLASMAADNKTDADCLTVNLREAVKCFSICR